MSFSRSLLVAAVALSALQTACIGTGDDIEASAIEPMGAETLDGPAGTGTVNGLGARRFNGYKHLLLEATDKQLAFDSKVHQDIVDTNLLDSPFGQDVFRYAMKLGLAAETIVIHEDTNYFVGEGVLSTTAGWLNGGLSDSAKEDLFAGMVALVNPAGNEVPIVFTGENVRIDGKDYSPFTFSEALWTATYDPIAETVSFDVWPSPELLDLCLNPITHVINDRVCDNGLGGCGVTVHGAETDIKTQCTEDPVTGHYTCNGRPALRTWLKADDVLDVNPECDAPQ